MKTITCTVTIPQSGLLTMTGPCPVNWGSWSNCSSSGVKTATGTGAPGGPLTKSQQCGPIYMGCYQDGNNGVRTMPNTQGIYNVKTVQLLNVGMETLPLHFTRRV
jgi:hypothetical protein